VRSCIGSVLLIVGGDAGVESRPQRFGPGKKPSVNMRGKPEFIAAFFPPNESLRPMPRRELLTPAERVELFAFPADEGELIRLATLSKSDLAFIRQHRGLPNRLGVAVQMVYLRHPGRALGIRETPHARVLELVASQLDLAPADWDAYAVRSATRREHLAELSALLGMEAFGRAHHQEMIEHVLPAAVQTTQGMPLAQAVIGELRRRRIELPPMATLERLCAVAATRAQRQIHQLLVAPLSPQQRDAIDKVLELREGSSASTLAWLRQSPGKPSAKSVLAHIERLTAIRDLGLPPDIGRDVPLSRVSRIAREGAQIAVYQIQEYETERRHATMVAILVDTAATITDEILNLHDRLIGSFFTKDKNRYERRFADDGKALNEKVRLYAQVGSGFCRVKEFSPENARIREAETLMKQGSHRSSKTRFWRKIP
jgi:hypothetical protein